MTVEEAIRDHLLTVDAVTDIASTRVYQLVVRQNSVMPAARVQVINEPIDYHLRGENGLKSTLVQLDAYATEAQGYAVASSLAEAMHEAISGQIFSVGSPAQVQILGAFRQSRRVLYESGEMRLVRVSQDFVIWSDSVN